MIRQDCEAIIAMLESCASYEWAELYVRHRMRFWREHCQGLIFSTLHGAEFFQNVLDCINGKRWEPEKEAGQPEGEYEENFRKFVKYCRKENYEPNT